MEKHSTAAKTTPEIQIYRLPSAAQKSGNGGEAHDLWDTDSSTLCILQTSR